MYESEVLATILLYKICAFPLIKGEHKKLNSF